MNQPLFNPFEPLNFADNVCFLTGKQLPAGEGNTIPVFPSWLLIRYQLEDTSMAMLGGNRMKYSEMYLPASEEVSAAVAKMDNRVQQAFEEGYEAARELPELVLFQWMARIMYGVLYQDFTYAISRHEARGRTFQVSKLMQQKLKNLLFMLQSLIRPVEFDGFCPWTMKCYQVELSKDILNYKDETHNLNFCLGMNGFAIIACLQDNGDVAEYNGEILEKIGEAPLHPAQLEELYGRFLYSSYLLRETEGYRISEKGDTLVFRLPENTQKNLPLFAEWKDETFAQVLANLWQPWGIPLEKIYHFPNAPISYLVDEFTGAFIPRENVNLPY